MDYNYKKGFTLIEIVIAIFILSFCLIGIFSAYSIVVIATSDTKDRLTATYLGQEGMEIVRNIRDTNWLNMDICASGGTPPNGMPCSGIFCKADYSSTADLKPYTHLDYLKIDSNGFYNYAFGTPTKFQRKIIVKPVTDVDWKYDHILKVIVQVFWDKKATILSSGVKASDGCCPDITNPKCLNAGSNCITMEETLYDWYNYVNH
jgi:prepilin-type N-terminal cleavage/methylation domain-containing protein